ncbi:MULTISPECIES: YajQ family cyclic di-GMP-binding protein [unclassified Modicisalibacter]|uniref:YajQ family cyclic di-GMP-binding protein n=1 Tax=unclassified Modicisalibacter TaxID=2679913 RepID=UPI001CCC8102|nr:MULTISPECIES: YajQ family cyclic di-GMP-binding protein [unclassified Modicisalibacter]MBZ9560106.1 YajQ family cyclic di-GMP-binding protein [Modicisalibacter sp. R2A 31.J]MBZ9576014.1 YajQ family cyclic di-GMP-binding protein [Modicisalibacter sp. MOD 31.J]
MPSFDIVSELDKHEVTNAVDQANRELTTRFDFRGVTASFSEETDAVLMEADAEFQLRQMLDILKARLIARGIDVGCLEEETAETGGVRVRQRIVLRQGIDQPLAKKIVKSLKDAKLKVQAQIQGDKVRVTGKKRDDLQQAIALLKSDESIELPLQFNNFRD